MIEQQANLINKSQLKVGRWVLAATVLVSGMDFASQSAVTVALPAIQSAFQASGAQLLWIVNGYALLLAALILVGGSLGDKLGRKRVLMTGIGSLNPRRSSSWFISGNMAIFLVHCNVRLFG